MSLRTAFTELLNISVPIMQAPIGSCSCPELAAAVSNAGGLGMLALSWDTLERCRGKVESTLRLTRQPFGINLVLAWDQSQRLETCLEAGARVVSFFWGDAKPYLGRVHAARARAIVAVGTADEARRAADLGANAVLCQGYEAGGHVWGKVASMALIPAVADAVSPLPVIAAGGIGDARGLVAALSLGASGVCMGTRFVASQESCAHREYKQRIVRAHAEDAVYTLLFDGGWEHAAHRVLRNRTLDEWEKAGEPRRGSRPREGEIIGRIGESRQVYRYDDMPPIAAMEGDWEACALYAGQSAGVVHSIKPAGDIVRDIVRQASEIIRSLSLKKERQQ